MRLSKILASTLVLLSIYCSALAAEPIESSEHGDNSKSTRGLVDLSNTFISKGEWLVGGSVSYSEHTNKGFQVLVVDDIFSEGYSFKVSPMFTYAYANNRAVGARVVYNRSLLKIDNATLSFGDEDSAVNLAASDFYSLNHTYSLQAIMRQYIPLGNSKRFALFNELQLGVGGSQAKFAMDTPVTGTYSKGHNYSLGLTPGVVAFASNRTTVEISVGVLGLSYQNNEQVHNQVTVGETHSKSINFKINILSIGFGLGIYI